MKSGSSAGGIYAEALADLAGEAGAREEIEEQLQGVAEAVTQEEAVWQFFRSPVLPVEDRLTVIERVFKGKVHELVFNLLRVLARRKRLGALPDVATAYTEIMDRELVRRRVEVASAVSLSEDERKRISEAMQVYLKAQVVLTVQERPDLIGGLMVRSGDLMIDTSLQSGLHRIRAALLRRKTIGKEFYEN